MYHRNPKNAGAMMMCVFRFFVVAAAVVAAASCGQNGRGGDRLVAKVGEKQLYLSEMSELVPKGSPREDSLTLTRLYVDNWIKTQLLLARAELNLSKDQVDITREIEMYRTSLLIYKYEEQLLREKLDTMVREEEVDAYYEANTASFSLDEMAVRAVFLKFPSTAPELWRVRQWLMSDRDVDVVALTAYCREHALSYSFFEDDWVMWSQIEAEFPQKDAATRQLAYGNRVEQEEGGVVWMVRVKERRAQGDVAPQVFVNEKIRSIIINKRKLKFIGELEQNIYNDALLRKLFEIYPAQ